MCGRFTMRRSVDELAARFGVANVAATVDARFNIAPTQEVAVVTDEGERALRSFVWGLVPFWAKDRSIGNRMINARAETLAEKPAFKHALARRRCLVPADGFYEWRKEGGRSTPYYFRFPDDRLFAFAGLWERWESPEGETLHTCSIVTVEPNRLVAPVHNRMPAILLPEEEDVWLAPPEGNPSALVTLLHPYPDDEMEGYAVSRAVNSPSFDDPACVAPGEEEGE